MLVETKIKNIALKRHGTQIPTIMPTIILVAEVSIRILMELMCNLLSILQNLWELI